MPLSAEKSLVSPHSCKVSEVSFMPVSGFKSVTRGQLMILRNVNGMPCSGDRSRTCELCKYNVSSGMFLRGTRSDLRTIVEIQGQLAVAVHRQALTQPSPGSFDFGPMNVQQ